MKRILSSRTSNRSQLGAVIFALWIALILPAIAYGVSYARSGSTVVRVSGETIENGNILPDGTNYSLLERNAALSSDLDTRQQSQALLEKQYSAWSASLHVPVTRWNALSVNQNSVVVAVERSLYVSSDGGAKWEPILNVLPGTFSALVVSPANPALLYAGIDSLGMYASRDGGHSWSLIQPNVAIPSEMRFGISALAIDPQNPNRLIVSAGLWTGAGYTQFRPLGLVVSGDGGSTWTAVPGLSARPFTRLMLDGTVLHVWEGTVEQSIRLN